ncbi:MAG: type I methionyl aminopeptidase [Candidatus Brocadiia bacterium]
MITLKSTRELDRIRTACRIVAEARDLVRSLAGPGVATGYLDKQVEKLIIEKGARPAFKGHGAAGRRPPFPASICASINHEVVHGIPGPRELCPGDLLSVDVGVECEGYYGDAALTVPIGEVCEPARRLMDTCREALRRAIAAIGPGKRLSAIARAVQGHVEENGFSVVRDLVGHGIGAQLWEEPQVPNYYSPGFADVSLRPGMVIAIEPMINEGDWRVKTLPNRWTVVTRDGSLSAHFEHTVAITREGVEVLTAEPSQEE